MLKTAIGYLLFAIPVILCIVLAMTMQRWQLALMILGMAVLVLSIACIQAGMHLLGREEHDDPFQPE